MKVTPLERQSVLDVAIQTSGGVEAAFALSVKNDISISEAIAPGSELETVDVVDKLVLNRYNARNVRPATELSPADLERTPLGGIGYMAIDIDFIVK